MNIYKKIERELYLVIEALKAEGKLPADVKSDKVEATASRDAAHGEIATNAAMVIAAQTKANPKEIAALLAEKLSGLAGITRAEIAGPGFINLTLAPSIWQEAILDIVEHGRGYGNSNVGEGIKVNVEYVSANPTGPMHVGHGRGAVFGDALATLLVKAGYSVTKEYYINDAGAQVDKVADSVFLRYREACGEKIGEIPEGLYPGDYLVPVGEALARIHGDKLLKKDRAEWLPVVREYALEAIMEMIKSDLAVLGIHHDVFTSEKALADAGKVQEAFDTLDKQGYIYTGTLPAPKGKIIEDWEPKELVLFRSSQFGDDSDRPMKKSDGAWTYIAPDIAYHYDKIQRGFKKMVLVLGADHVGYQKRLQAAVKALSGGEAQLDVKLCQLVKFIKGGAELKMSKRAGTFVTVREVVDEVGKDVFRFIMLTRKNDAPLDFDFAKVTEQSKDNPVFYVQYAHARARSVLRNAQEVTGARYQVSGKEEKKSSDPCHPTPDTLAKLNHPAELALIRLMCGWPRLVESAASAHEPHRVAFYLHDLAAAFHGLWHLGNDDIMLRFIVKSDIELTAARIALAQAVSQVIASGLLVLGVEPVEEMR